MRLVVSQRTWRLVVAIAICFVGFDIYWYRDEAQRYRETGLHISHSTQTDTLLPVVFRSLPLGKIRPLGWLRDELEASAAGLAGHEFDFYEYVKRSPWLGGDREYAKLNEGLPYWFNGLVFLAYGLNDERLQAQVHHVAEYVLEHQQADGWIGPEKPGLRTLWARYPFFLGLTGLAEANTSWTGLIVGRMHRFVNLMHLMLSNHGDGYIWHDHDQLTQRDFSWGQARSADMVLSLMWLFENHPQGRDLQLLEVARMLHDQGVRWESWYNLGAYMRHDTSLPGDRGDLRPSFEWMHGVNVAQGLKSPAVYRRLTKNDSLIRTAWDGVDWTFAAHGSSLGTIIADDVISDQAPYRGSELCTTVEAMFSLSYLYQALGNTTFADRCERAAFNALPASLTSDWWAHQYMQQVNQPWSKKLNQSPFIHTNDLSQIFGLEPNLPCCTLNHPQGLPKFLAASFVLYGMNGLAHALLGPSEVITTLSSGAFVSVTCETSYPFGEILSYSVNTSAAFDFLVRIPAWSPADQTQVMLNGATIEPVVDTITGMVLIRAPSGLSIMEVVLHASILVEPRSNDTVAVTRGALVYALNIDADVQSTKPRSYKNQSMFGDNYAPDAARDYAMVGSGVWNLAIDPSTLQWRSMSSVEQQRSVTAHASGYIYGSACEIEWPLYKNSTPDIPIPVEDRRCLGDIFNITLTPVGGAKLHMVDFPVMQLT